MTTKKEKLDIPKTSLPLFAYGIFKPGQLAYSKIKEHVNENNLKNIKIDYEMKYRDGVPILTNKSKEYHTKGVLITFKESHEKKAYEIISETFLKELYRWETIKIENQKVNVLFGVKPNKGSDNINYRDKFNFNGEKDPLFSEAIELIEENLNLNKKMESIESFFELQMNYMLLWSAIDRYSTLKYNNEYKGENNKDFANEEAFIEGIKKFKDNTHEPVYSSEDLNQRKFFEDDHEKTINYYYTFRCNVVHRGKGEPEKDYKKLRQATEELLEIFKDVLKNTFNET